MHSIRHSITGALLFVLIGTQAATSGSGGSTYSLLGLGDLSYAPGTRAEGMGYAGLALFSPRYIDPLSPASWSRIEKVRIEGSALYEGFRSTDGITSRYLARMDFHGILLGIPASRSSGIVVVAGFTPYSSVNYDTYTSATIPSQNVDPVTGQHDSLGYQIHQSGTGGLTKGQLGMSWAPSPQLSFGASFNYVFGTIDHISTQVPLTTGTSGGTFTDRMTLSGVSFTAGMMLTTLEGIGTGLRPFSLGFVVTTHSHLNSVTETMYDYAPPPNTTVTLHDTSGKTYGRVAVPFSYGVGVGFQMNERWVLAADFSAQPWGNSNFNGTTPYGIGNSYRLGMGAEREGSNELNAKAFDRWSYRFGLTYAGTYYQINGQQVNEWGITGGLAFPITGESRLNVAAMYGGRGTLAGDLVKDKIFRLTVSLHISDILP
ncbi:MAG TPA: hypothetical protein VK569_11115, partial [Bacteroidota bacterium]|nr:hypothetical protein [Bacteroidota bacterium]